MPSIIAEFLVRSRQCEVAGLEHLLEASTLIARVRALVHALQRERGASTLVLNSRGEVYGERVQQYREDAGTAERQLRRALEDWLVGPRCHHAGSRLHASIALALHALDTLPALRTEIDRLRLDIDT